MSIVLVCATAKEITMKSDGRATDNGVIVAEDIQKFVRISNNYLIGYVGNLRFCAKTVLDYIRNHQYIDDLPFLLDNFKIHLQKSYPGSQYSSQFCIAGFYNNKPMICAIEPPYTEWVYTHMSKPVNPLIMGDPRLAAFSFEPRFAKYKKSMDAYIRYVSKHIETINDNIFTETISI